MKAILTLCALLIFATPLSAAEETVPPKVGEEARDFSLKDSSGETVQLSKLEKKGPVVLLVLRGFPGYQCPICSRQVVDYLARAKEFAAANANVVLVYPGPAEKLKEHADEFISGKTLPANVTLVIDPAYEFTNAWGLRWDAERETAYPSTFVIDAKNKIVFAKISKTHGGRTKAAEIVEVLKKAE